MKDTRQACNAMLSGQPTRPIVAPLWDGIFAAPIVGKEFPGDVTFDEVLDVADLCGFDPLIRVDGGALWAPVESLRMESRTEPHNDMRRRFSKFTCPAGTITLVADEPRHTSGTCIKDATDSPQVYDVIEWYFTEVLRHKDVMFVQAKMLADKYGHRGSLQIAWITPVELNFMAYPNIITMYLDNRDRHRALADLNFEVLKAITLAASAAGFDVFYLAGPPIELVGYNLYGEMGEHYLTAAREFIHANNMWMRFHNCGHIKRMLREGTYNRILPDIFETLAPPPMGELDDLRWARKQLDQRIITHGNIDLEFIKNATPAQVAKRAAQVLEETRGYRHMLAGCDELLWGTPVENVKAMVEGAMSTAK